MGNKVLYISDGNGIDDYFIHDNLGDRIDFVENVDFIIESSTFANPHFVSIDWFYSQKVEGINYNDYDLIVIPSSLSNDVYFSFSGIRLAIHFRLFRESKFLPILIIGPESFIELSKFSDYSGFLSSPGIYTLSDENNTVLGIYPCVREILLQYKPLTEIAYLESLKKITVEPISFLDSRHSRANEWALTRLFSMFRQDEHSVLYKNLREKLNKLNYLKTLHFKYNEAKASRQKFKVKHSIIPKITGIAETTIGIIDDEIGKGWKEFYEYVFSMSNAKAVFFEDFKKGTARTDLLDKLNEWIRRFQELSKKIDVFIIDLRLNEEDFREQDYIKLTGFQIINIIRLINPGIQILVLTASNKVWSYQKSLKLGVKYFSIKESPDTFNTKRESIDNFDHFSKQLSLAVSESYLAELFRNKEVLKTQNKFKNVLGTNSLHFISTTFYENGLLDQIFKLLDIGGTNEFILNQCLVLAFQILENYCNSEIVGIFEYDNSNGHKGSIWNLDSSGPRNIFTNYKNEKKISTMFELTPGHFTFQLKDSKETPISFKVYEKLELTSTYKKWGVEQTFIVRLISVLYFREGILQKDIERIMSLRYFRSNVAAHLTGNTDPNFKINKDDIIFLFEIMKRIFI
jgi:hypothetical protein